MSYSRRAYVDLSETLARTLDEILEDETLTEAQRESQQDGVSRVAEKIAEVFEADNHKGFNKDRFFDDVYGPED